MSMERMPRVRALCGHWIRPQNEGHRIALGSHPVDCASCDMGLLLGKAHIQDIVATNYSQRLIDTDVRILGGPELFAGRTDFEVNLVQAAWVTWVALQLKEYKELLQYIGLLEIAAWQRRWRLRFDCSRLRVYEHAEPNGDLRIEIAIDRRPGRASRSPWEYYLPDPEVEED